MISPLKSDWKTVKFGEVVKNANLTERDPKAAGIDRIVGLEHLDPENLHVRRWNTLENGTSFSRKFVPGQTLFGKRRTYQRKVAFAEFEGICSGDILTFEPKDPDVLLPELLPFICQTDAFFDHALGTSAGSLSPRTSWKALQDFEFPLPPIEEQKRIAEILWAADEAVETLVQARKNAETLVSIAIDEMFYSAFGDLRVKLRDIHNSPIKDGWKVLSLSDVTSKIVDGVHKTPNYKGSGVPFIVVENLNRGRSIDFSNTRFISLDDHREFTKRTNPEKGDVLVSKDGTLGVSRVVETDLDFSIFVSLALLKPKRQMLDSNYLKYYIDSSIFKKHVLMHSSGSALKHIHLVDFRSAPIPVPPLDRQIYLINGVRHAEKALEDCEHHIDIVRHTKSALMREIIAGEPAYV